ncbi:MAG: transposase, partial [Burkholderiaceae bacterium]|nr:transposase [Burkholderiaceae bacterium]
MKQGRLGLSNPVKRTRKREFLDAMELVVPWAELVSLIEHYAPESGRLGQQPFAVQTLLRIHFIQQWFKLSDPATEEALHDVLAFRDFAGLSHWDAHIPSESSILRFRHLLERHKLADQILATVNALLQAKGLQLKGYQGIDKRPDAKPTARWHVALRPGLRRALEALDKDKPLEALIDQLECTKASIRAKVERPFRVLKQQFGYVKVRYRGLKKNTAQIVTLF